jgi:hypothetical protein
MTTKFKQENNMNLQLPNILKLDVAGKPLDWMNYERAAYYYGSDKVAWDLGDQYTLKGGTNAATLMRSTLDVKNIVAVKGEVAKHKHVGTPSLENKALFARDKNICAYCGNHFNNADLTRDHVHPQSKGGPNIWTNVVTACKRCNNLKGDLDIAKCRFKLLYVPYKPDFAEALILRNRRILADQMDYLLGFVKNKDSRILN